MPGFKNIFNLFIYKFFTLTYALTFGLVILLIIRAISPFFLIRLAQLKNTKIGHYIVNTELYLCEKEKKINIPKVKFLDLFYLTPRKSDCNSQLTKMWKRKIRILPWQFLRVIDILNKLIPGGAQHNINNLHGKSWDTKNLLDIDNKNLYFTQDEKEQGKNFLKKIGLSENNKFVCLLVRDEAYDKAVEDKKNQNNYHSYRNCDVSDFIKACNYLTEKGFYVFRMGKTVNKSLNINNKRVIDYANNGMRSDFLDIYLGAHCSFWISTGTGIDALAQVFRIPSVFTNETPLLGIRTGQPNSIFTIKKLFDRKINKKMSIKETIQNKLDFVFKTEDFEKKNISVISNTSDEILNAVKDFYEIFYEKKELSNYDQDLQKKFWNLFPYKKELHGNIKTILSPSFLRNNIYLLK